MTPTQPLVGTVSVSAHPAHASEALFERLYAEYQTPILNYLYRLLGEPALAEDLTQEAFVRAWRARHSLPEVRNHRAWVYRIATNLARDHIRRARLLAWLPFFGAEDHEPALRVEAAEPDPLEAAQLRAALGRLSADYRVPLVLYTCEAMSVTEIAGLLEVSAEAVKQRLVRARQQLRRAFEAGAP